MFIGGNLLKIFVKVLESGIAFSLVTAIVFAYYQTENIGKKRIVISLSLMLGFISGGISAVLRSIPNFLNRANLSYYSMIFVVVSMILLLVIVLFKGKFRERLFENLLTAAVMLYVVSSHFYYLPSILLTSNSFVYYGESVVSTMVLYRVLGFVFAIILMIVSAFMVHTAALKLKRRTVGVVMTIALLIMSLTQINVIAQRLYSLRIIPKNKVIFQMIAFTSNHTNYFYFAVMIFLAVLPLMLFLKNMRLSGNFANSAQLRKAKYLMRHKRRIASFLMTILLFNILSLSYIKAYAYREIPLSPPEPYDIVDGVIQLPLDLFEDNLLHRYEYKSYNGLNVRFIVIKKAEGSYGVCLDACEICGPSGYFMRDNDVVCKLCDVVMNKGTIGFKGGCNPIPIEYMVHDKKIKIPLRVLDSMDYIFK